MRLRPNEDVAVTAVEFSMTDRRFDDWSPASVFGPTTDSPRREPKAKKSPLDDNNQTRDQPQRVNSAKRTTPEEEEHDAQQDDAVRILQKHWRIWLLYRREIESLHAVAQLRQQLEFVSAQTIAAWYRRSLQRFAIHRYLRYYHQQAGKCLVQWLYWHFSIARVRRVLQRRIVARRRIVCWWRRVLVIRRCHLQAHAKRIVCHFLTRTIHARRIRRLATKRIQTFVHDIVQRQRAVAIANRRRCGRARVRSANHVVQTYHCRRAFGRWVETTWREREAEQTHRRYHAACVLQRLVRVVLTAFRLLRRRDAATKIQSIVRRRLAHRQISILRIQRQEKAAIQIQRMARGFLARHRFARLLQQLRERFRCQNCGLIEPGGLYCKLCGRRRTTFDVLNANAVAMNCTTDAKLRKKRRKVAIETGGTSCPPPAPALSGYRHETHRHGGTIGPTMLMMTMPELTAPSLPPIGKRLHPEPPIVLPIRPHKPTHMCSATVRPPRLYHRSLSFTSADVPGPTSADKTRQRAEVLAQREQQEQSNAMTLHLKRLQKGDKAASR